MSDANSGLLKAAKAQAAARELSEDFVDYEELAEVFRKFTSLDSQSCGPELAMLQNLTRTVPPQPLGLGGAIRRSFFSLVNPLLGRFLRMASLASPYQAAYELALHLQKQQLETERRILSELGSLGARLELLESELRSRKLGP
jgi:hypothetical protein